MNSATSAPGLAAAVKATPLQAASGALVPNVELNQVAEVESKPLATRAPEAAARWSESEAAERASAVFRSLRVQLQPALRSATVHLAPADLGRLKIEMQVEGGRVRAVLHAETPETLAILERHLPELQAAFEGQGLEAESFELELGFGQDEHAAREGGDSHLSAEAQADAASEAAIDTDQLARAIASRSGLDTYA